MPRLTLEELHPLYRKVSHDEAVAIANLGAVSYLEARDRLFEVWTEAQSAEEAARAAALRAEGAAAAEAALADRLAAGDAAKSRIAVLQASVDALVAERLAAAVEKDRLRYELEVAAPLRQRLAALENKEETLALLRQTNGLLQAKLDAAVASLEDLKEAATKSSHSIGKAGEATVWEMIESCVLPEFPYAEAKNMSGVSHAADFHLWVMGPSGQRVKMLIDSKKYKRAVNSDEINKLIADVDADEEAHAGLMLSLASPICTTKQFQIRASNKGKPILYLSFFEVDQDQHARILCWAIRALVAAVHESREEVSLEIERTEELLTDICNAMKDVDGMVKTHQKMIEGLRGIKNGILQKITDFRGEESDQTVGEGCVTVLKATGVRCGKEVYNGSNKCRHHTSRKEKATES
ncbi:MAG: hypothetical protein EBZ61_10280 [Micrococcales bacterium]|nr:hypothetical protein [Micrococcales bacterium]